MATAGKAKYTGLLLDLFVVCLGVLIALGAESWWEGREDRARVRTYLGAVATDLSLAREGLDSAIERNLGLLHGVRSDLDHIVAGEATNDTVLSTCCPGPSISNLPLGNFRALLETGDINLLTPDSLRTALISGFAILEESARRRAFSETQTFQAYAEASAEADQELARSGRPLGQLQLMAVAGNRDLQAAQRKYWAALRELVGEHVNIANAVAEMHEAIASQSGIEDIVPPRPSGASMGEAIDISDAVLERHVGRYRMLWINGPEVLTVELKDGALTAGLDGVEYRLIPESESAFFTDEQGIQIDFDDTEDPASALLYLLGFTVRITAID